MPNQKILRTAGESSRWLSSAGRASAARFAVTAVDRGHGLVAERCAAHQRELARLGHVREERLARAGQVRKGVQPELIDQVGADQRPGEADPAVRDDLAVAVL